MLRLADHLNAECGRWPLSGSIPLILDGDPLAGFEGTFRRALCGDFGLGGQPKDIIEQPLLGAYDDIPTIPIQLNDLPLPLLHLPGADQGHGACPRPDENSQ